MGGFYLNLNEPKKPNKKQQKEKLSIKDRIIKNGYVIIKSETLGMDIFWIKNEQIKKRLPKNVIAYTLDELKELKGISKKELVDYNIAKIFNGKYLKASDAEAFLKTFQCEK